MINHTPLDLYSFKEAIQNTETFRKIGNTEFQKLYFKTKTIERLFQNYKWGIREGIEYLKSKPSLQSRDVRIIEEILNK